MTGEEMGLSLKAARERVCLVQTHVESPGLREQLQIAYDAICRVGVMVDRHWSKHDFPATAELDDDWDIQP